MLSAHQLKNFYPKMAKKNRTPITNDNENRNTMKLHHFFKKNVGDTLSREGMSLRKKNEYT